MSKFNIIKESIEPKTSHNGEKYYDFFVEWSEQNTKGKFQYWPYTKGWKKGYVEIYDYSLGLEDGPMLELANGKLTDEMYEYHNKTYKLEA